MFIDMEGTPVQELSAVAMDMSDKVAIDIYHKYAYCPPHKDKWARRHIHGLDPFLLKEYGFRCEDELLEDFRKWLSQFPNINTMYANNPTKEKSYLKMDIKDIGLPVWSERVKHRYHKIPNALKEDNDCIFMQLGVYCHLDIHSKFCYSPPPLTDSANHLAKANSSFHCSLCDVSELYLYYRQEYM